MDTIERKERKELLLSLRPRFVDGATYTLSVDVANPGRDKRKRHGSGFDAQPDVFPRGARFLCAVYRNDVVLRQKSGGGDVEVRMTFDRLDIDGKIVETAHLHTGLDERHDHSAVDIIVGLVPEDRSVVTIEARYGGRHRYGWRTLEQLVASGKLTVADVSDAVEAVNAKDEE